MINILENYLEEIQKDNRTWRKRVEVYIRKENKIVVGMHKRFKIILPPGGGIDKGETLNQAAKRECLEEVGIKIKNIKKIAEYKSLNNWTQKQIDDNEELQRKNKLYKGAIVQYVVCDYDGVNKTLYNKNKEDKMKIYEFTIPELIKIFKKQENNDLSILKQRIKVLNTIEKMK